MRATVRQLIFAVRIPQHGGEITLNGHQSKILVTDFGFGSRTLLYSTAEVLTFARFGEREVLVLWLPEGETGEFTLLKSDGVKSTGKNRLKNLDMKEGDKSVTVSYTQDKGMFTLDLGGGSSILLLDREAAYRFWAPPLSNDPLAPENNTGESPKHRGGSRLT